MEENRQRGATLVFVTTLLVVFMGFAAMAVDLGWLYLNALRTQQAADAASLAGVVHMPDDFVSASADALDVAAVNRYVDATLGGDAAVVPAPVVDNDYQLQVTITRPVDTFFLKVFGMDQVSITRRAVAEYVLPLPMGSPEPTFGNDPHTGHQPNFWGNIHGRYTGQGMGDRYSSACLAWQSGPGCAANPEWRGRGYIYAVEVPPGASNLVVELYDPAFVQGGSNTILVGDNPQGGGDPGPTTRFTLYGADETPLQLADNGPPICSVPYAPRPAHPPGATFLDIPWEFFCSVAGPLQPGLYPLQITIDDPAGNERGLNRFSIRASTTGPEPRIFGVGDMSIYANVNAGLTEFFFAEVDPVHAGKNLIIDLWDPGDAAGNHSMTIVTPSGAAPACDVQVSDGSSFSLASCRIDTSGLRYNNLGLQITIPLPAGYGCGTDCWWKVRYDYPAQATDTTTWSAWIDGNPLRLVE